MVSHVRLRNHTYFVQLLMYIILYTPERRAKYSTFTPYFNIALVLDKNEALHYQFFHLLADLNKSDYF